MILPVGRAQPFFSIVLTTFNRWKLFERAIKSAIAQTFTDWELLVIDDGSKDGTYDWATIYIDRDNRIRYHYATNRGLAIARNWGLTMGQGKYFTFLDSDDEYHPDHLELRANYLQEHPEVELLHG